jgi:hypothetical protein
MGNKITLGSKVRFSKKLVRKGSNELDEAGMFHRYHRKWQNVETGPHDGVVVGVRNLRNGIIYYYPEEGNDFIPKEAFNAYQVSFHLYRKPVFVLLENLVLI